MNILKQILKLFQSSSKKGGKTTATATPKAATSAVSGKTECREAARPAEAKPATVTPPRPAAAKTWECGAEDEPEAVIATLSGTTLVFSGAGNMEDYDTDIPWESCGSTVITVAEVVVEEGVTSIGAEAFRGCRELASVTVAGSVCAIGRWAFRDCAGLASITVKNPVPPAADSQAFEGVDRPSVRLCVPADSVEAYKSAEGWQGFNVSPAS